MSGWMLYGPLEHDAPRPTWAVEREELTGLMRGAMKYMTGETEDGGVVLRKPVLGIEGGVRCERFWKTNRKCGLRSISCD
ncbi:hypothetical protein VTK26DRAFT_3896 [Humicola hyalothermophila]